MTNLTPDPNTEIFNLSPTELLEIQAAFGQLVLENPRLTQFVNNLGPVLFATALFTTMQEFKISECGEFVEATNSTVEAESKAIGWVRSVAAAFGQLDGDVTLEPSDAEVDADTEIAPI